MLCEQKFLQQTPMSNRKVLHLYSTRFYTWSSPYCQITESIRNAPHITHLEKREKDYISPFTIGLELLQARGKIKKKKTS